MSNKDDVVNPELISTSEDGSRSMYEHPAYGQVVLSRGSGGGVLHGLDFSPSHRINLSIRHGKMERQEGGNSYVAGAEVVRVSMSEAQFAELITNIGASEGTPCTITRLQNQSVAGLPKPESTVKKLREDIAAQFERANATLRSLSEKIEGCSATKKAKEEMLSELKGALMLMNDGMPYLAESFDEHIEGTVSKAKREIFAAMNEGAKSLGLSVAKEDASNNVRILLGNT